MHRRVPIGSAFTTVPSADTTSITACAAAPAGAVDLNHRAWPVSSVRVATGTGGANEDLPRRRLKQGELLLLLALLFVPSHGLPWRRHGKPIAHGWRKRKDTPPATEYRAADTTPARVDVMIGRNCTFAAPPRVTELAAAAAARVPAPWRLPARGSRAMSSGRRLRSHSSAQGNKAGSPSGVSGSGGAGTETPADSAAAAAGTDGNGTTGAPKSTATSTSEPQLDRTYPVRLGESFFVGQGAASATRLCSFRCKHSLCAATLAGVRVQTAVCGLPQMTSNPQLSTHASLLSSMWAVTRKSQSSSRTSRWARRVLRTCRSPHTCGDRTLMKLSPSRGRMSSVRLTIACSCSPARSTCWSACTRASSHCATFESPPACQNTCRCG